MSGTDRPLERVQRRGMRSGAAIVAAVGLLLVGFAAGSRVGGLPGPTTPVVTPLPTQTVAQAPTQTPFPEPVVKLDAVDPALQQAYYRSGAGFAICVVDSQPSCESHASIVPLKDPNLPATFTDRVWARLHPFRVSGHALVAVEALDAASVRATLLEITSDPNETLGHEVVVANPAGQGIYYIDLGYQSAGRYLVIVRALVGPPNQAPDSTGATYGWQTNLLALEADVASVDPVASERPPR